MARWTRAIAALPLRQGRVLDLGCAFGFATRKLRRRGYDAVGVDADASYIERARQADPTGSYLVCDAAHVPCADGSFDAVLCLDVLEHVPDERAVLMEAARLLKPGGTLIVSVPHRGSLARLDSLNLFARLVEASGRGTFPAEIAATRVHRHYTVEDMRSLLGSAFAVSRVWRTGLGVAELVHLPLLVAFRWLMRWEALYEKAAFAYYTLYLAEDLMPLGPAGYHLMMAATCRDTLPDTTDGAPPAARALTPIDTCA